MLEVNVDIRWLVPFPADEAFKEHAHARGIDFGDAQGIANG